MSEPINANILAWMSCDYLGEMVRGTAANTLNTMLDTDADALPRAGQ